MRHWELFVDERVLAVPIRLNMARVNHFDFQFIERNYLHRQHRFERSARHASELRMQEFHVRFTVEVVVILLPLREERRIRDIDSSQRHQALALPTQLHIVLTRL